MGDVGDGIPIVSLHKLGPPLEVGRRKMTSPILVGSYQLCPSFLLQRLEFQRITAQQAQVDPEVELRFCLYGSS